MTDFPEAISASSRADFDICPTKFYYSKVRGIWRDRRTNHATFGAAFAAGLEAFRWAYYNDERPMIDCYKAAIEAIIKDWGEEDPFGDGKKDLATCILAFDDYITTYRPDEDPVQPAMLGGKPAVEFTFSVPIPGVSHPQTGGPILYEGRFDMIANYKGMLFIEDDKTSGNLGSSWQKQFEMSSQITGYIWACQMYDLDVERAIIRGVGIYKTYFAHQMVLQTRSKWFIDRWLEQLQRDVERMIEMWRSGVWDMSLDHGCSAYGGCAYIPLCSSPYPEKWIEQEYMEAGDAYR